MSRLVFAVACLVCACGEAPPIIEATTQLTSTADTTGPYVVQSVVVGVTDHAVELRYRVDDERRFIPLVMSADPTGERFAAGIPGLPPGSTVSYYVAVLADDGERVAADPEAAGARPYVFTIRSE